MTIKETQFHRGEQIQHSIDVTKKNFWLPLKRVESPPSHPDWLPMNTALSITVYGAHDYTERGYGEGNMIVESNHWHGNGAGVSGTHRVITGEKINGKHPHKHGYRVVDTQGILHVFTYEPDAT